MKSYWRVEVGLIALLVCAATVRADGGDTAPFVLARAIPLPIKSYTAADLEQMFPQFKHRSFGSAGFDALMLPFHYEDHSNGGGDANEAQAFAFLLSNDLDWAPGSYCARHAYFAFKRSRDEMMPLVSDYGAPAIADLISFWQATNAIGGTIERQTDGYTGTLNIFGPSGQTVYTNQFNQHQSFWGLLESMSADTMTYFGEEPPQSLKDFLKQPRCKRMQSIAALGSAAFMRERSDAEFGVYRKILDTDPDFAEVRTWYANQNGWKTYDVREKEHQLGMVLRSRIVMMALGEFDPDFCPDTDAVDKYPDELREAERIAGPDSPYTLQHELSRLLKNPAPATDLLSRATQAAARYPNSLELLDSVASAYRNPVIGRGDAGMAASVDLAELENRFQTGIGNKDVQANQFLEDAFNYGCRDPGLVAAVKQVADLEDVAALQKWFIGLLAQAGQFQTVIPIAKSAINDDASLDFGFASPLAFSAAMCGDRDTLDHCIRNYGKAIDNDELRDAFQYCSDRLAGRKPSSALPTSKPSWIFAVQVNWAILAEDDWARHEHKHRDSLIHASNWQPQARIGWIIHDMYDRQEPTKYNDDFYRSIEWLYPDDPWVVAAVADYKARTKSKVTPTSQPADVLADLAQFDAGPDITPDNPQLGYANDLGGRLTSWRIVISIRRLVEAGRIDDARLLAHRYQSAVCCWEKNAWLQGFASRILGRIDQIQAQQSSTAN